MSSSFVYREKGRPFSDADIKPYRESLIHLGQEQGCASSCKGSWICRWRSTPSAREARPRSAGRRSGRRISAHAPMPRRARTSGTISMARRSRSRARCFSSMPTPPLPGASPGTRSRATITRTSRHSMALTPASREIKSDWLDALVNIATPVVTVFLVVIGFTVPDPRVQGPPDSVCPRSSRRSCSCWCSGRNRGWRRSNSLAILLFLLGIVLILVALPCAGPGGDDPERHCFDPPEPVAPDGSPLAAERSGVPGVQKARRVWCRVASVLLRRLYARSLLALCPYANRMILQPPDEETEARNASRRRSACSIRRTAGGDRRRGHRAAARRRGTLRRSVCRCASPREAMSVRRTACRWFDRRPASSSKQ